MWLSASVLVSLSSVTIGCSCHLPSCLVCSLRSSRIRCPHLLRYLVPQKIILLLPSERLASSIVTLSLFIALPSLRRPRIPLSVSVLLIPTIRLPLPLRITLVSVSENALPSFPYSQNYRGLEMLTANLLQTSQTIGNPGPAKMEFVFLLVTRVRKNSIAMMKVLLAFFYIYAGPN